MEQCCRSGNEAHTPVEAQTPNNEAQTPVEQSRRLSHEVQTPENDILTPDDSVQIPENEEEEEIDDDEEELKETEEEENEEEEDEDEEADAEEEEDKMAFQAPDVDRGWAWVVLVSAFLGMTIFGTFTFSIGIFQAEVLQAVDPDVQKVSWIGATHLSVLCVTGIGTGMALNPMFVSMGFYFVRYRGFASGIIAAGSGAGMFIGGPIIRHLIDSYGLSGAYLIWGAVGLNIAVVGMCVHLPSIGGWGSVLGASSLLVFDKDAEGVLQQSQLLLDIPKGQETVFCEEVTTGTDGLENSLRIPWRPGWPRHFASSQLSVGSTDTGTYVKRGVSPLFLRGRPKSPTSFTDRRSSLQSGRSFICKAMCRCTDVLDSFRILRNPGFALYIFSNFMWIFGESTVFSYLPSFAESQGTSPFQSATLITAVGFTSTLSRLLAGFVAGDPSVGPELMHAGMLGLCGLFCITFPLYSSNFVGQCVFASGYGLYSGGLASVINILIIRFIGVEHIAIAFGFICFGQGIASLLGPTIAGAIVSSGGDFGNVFYFSDNRIYVIVAALFVLLDVLLLTLFIVVLVLPENVQTTDDPEASTSSLSRKVALEDSAFCLPCSKVYLNKLEVEQNRFKVNVHNATASDSDDLGICCEEPLSDLKYFVQTMGLIFVLAFSSLPSL
nr:hypothetical protein BaRGS_000564 [Batillaria attramentaria]